MHWSQILRRIKSFMFYLDSWLMNEQPLGLRYTAKAREKCSLHWNLHSVHQAGMCHLHSWPCHHRDEWSHDRYLTLHYPLLTFFLSTTLSPDLPSLPFFHPSAFNLPLLFLDLFIVLSSIYCLLWGFSLFASSVLFTTLTPNSAPSLASHFLSLVSGFNSVFYSGRQYGRQAFIITHSQNDPVHSGQAYGTLTHTHMILHWRSTYVCIELKKLRI